MIAPEVLVGLIGTFALGLVTAVTANYIFEARSRRREAATSNETMMKLGEILCSVERVDMKKREALTEQQRIDADEIVLAAGSAVNRAMNAYRKNEVFLSMMFPLKSTLDKASREIEVAALRARAITPEEEKDLDIDYSDKTRGRWARQRLLELGIDITKMNSKHES